MTKTFYVGDTKVTVVIEKIAPGFSREVLGFMFEAALKETVRLYGFNESQLIAKSPRTMALSKARQHCWAMLQRDFSSTEIAHRFNRDRSTISSGIKQHYATNKQTNTPTNRPSGS